MVIKMQPLGGVLLALTMLTSAACQKTGGDEAVQPQIVSMRNSPKLSRMPTGSTMAAGAEKVCYWNDKKYSDGATVCDNKIRHKCWTDKWVEIGQC